MKNFTYIFLLLFAGLAFADGLLVPNDKNYPKDLLLNRSTQVQVTIHGQIAETVVTQEFVNEWDKNIDALYAFPLPPDARATEFLYWYNDKVYKAVLKVKEQSSTPGTGEGGIIAYVNQYLGRNAIKVPLINIPAGGIQRVQLSYINQCDYYNGEVSYHFPLKTGDFVTYPLDHLAFSVYVESNSKIINYAAPGFSGFHEILKNDNKLFVEMQQAKAYLSSDFDFSYTTETDELAVDFYSCDNDSVDGHFAMLVRPQDDAVTADILPKRIVYVLSNSSNLAGYAFQACVDAIKTSLDQLSDQDEFNIIVYNYSSSYLLGNGDNCVQANAANIASAKNALDGLGTSWGSQMDIALARALEIITDASKNNIILLFSDGMSSIDPRQVHENNPKNAGIFPIGIGENISRQRLEMLAAENYGFVTYLEDDDNYRVKIEQLLAKVNSPILKNAVTEFGTVAGVYDLLPATVPSVYAGCSMLMTGRYHNPGSSAFAMAGLSAQGDAAFNFQFDFGALQDSLKFVEKLWAKEKIAALDREIEIYGETAELKQQMIDISLTYNIRCRYTAYVADYATEYTHVHEQNDIAVPQSYIIQNYPNPFNPTTTIRIYLAANSQGLTKILRIYNARGQLVAVIDLTNYVPGEHRILFNGQDFYGNALPSGHYFARLVVGDDVSTIRMLLIK